MCFFLGECTTPAVTFLVGKKHVLELCKKLDDTEASGIIIPGGGSWDVDFTSAQMSGVLPRKFIEILCTLEKMYVSCFFS